MTDKLSDQIAMKLYSIRRTLDAVACENCLTSGQDGTEQQKYVLSLLTDVAVILHEKRNVGDESMWRIP